MTIIVSPLSQLAQLIAARQPSHLLTLISPETDMPAQTGIDPAHHLTLRFHDLPVAMNGYTAPTRASITAILDFSASWTRARPLLIHCLAGVSRSTAAAYILSCQAAAPGREAELAVALRRASPFAMPNRMMVDIADGLLQRGGRMVNAVAAMGIGAACTEASPFEITL
jgi:predicted protein tyrosine phosphatase